jgi:hypothetical protein
VYLLCLALLSGILMLAGVSTAKSIEDTLPGYIATLWGGMLVFGSAITLLGMFWLGTVATGLLMKRVGMFTLTVAASVYGTVILIAFGAGGLFTAGVVYGFGAACFLQFQRINARVRQIIEVTP